MKHKIKQFTAALLIAASIIFCFHAAPVEAAPARLTNVHFYGWNKADFSSFTIKFVTRQTVDGYQIQLKTRSGKLLDSTIENEHLSTGTTYKYTYEGFPTNQVMIAYVRVFRYNSAHQRSYSAWSTGIFITPSPLYKTFKSSIADKKKNYVRLKWNMIHGCDGYKVYVTTNPSSGKWYMTKAVSGDTATSVTLTSYRGSRIKTGTTYYYYVLARRRRNGQDYKVYLPERLTCGSFRIYYK